ncbi:MAG: hypothetical protein DRP74_00105 [Candidatus Omnitrophota bacterium]|nr:MAG: hypothetical protein DRP74_00105 [Candidatus Omnitrophota bacterium]
MNPSFKDCLKDQKILKEILKLAKKRKLKVYLVGGYLRDIFLKREKENPDIDFCLKKNAIAFGRVVSRHLKAGFVILDKAHGCSRAVKKTKDKIYTLDFTDFRGATLEKDLLHRDFTLNSIALDLEKLLNSAKGKGKILDIPDLLIDPYGGRKDLAKRVIRIVNPRAFDEDPLRILRAFSLACVFHCKIEKRTLKLIKTKAKHLSRVSGERIRDEFFKMLSQPDSFKYFSEMDKLNVLKNIFPEIEVMRGVNQGPYHHLDVWQHTLETLKQLENVFEELKNNKDLNGYLNKEITYERRRSALIKLGALMHDIGKPKARRVEEGKIKFHGHERIGLEMTENIAKRLKLSKDELEALKKMVLWHLRPGYLADNEVLTARAKFRFFRDAAEESISTLLLSLADQRATKGRLTTRLSREQHEKVIAQLLKEYFKSRKEKKIVRLVNGDDLIKKFKLQPSPLIGKVLSELEELQVIGRIKTKKQALLKARQIISKVRSTEYRVQSKDR